MSGILRQPSWRRRAHRLLATTVRRVARLLIGAAEPHAVEPPGHLRKLCVRCHRGRAWPLRGMFHSATGRPRRLSTTRLIDIAPVAEELICGLHRHTTEVGNKVCAISVTGDVALAASSSVLSSKGKHVTAVTAPVRADVRERLEPVGNAMVDLLFIVLA